MRSEVKGEREELRAEVLLEVLKNKKGVKSTCLASHQLLLLSRGWCERGKSGVLAS